MRKFKIATVFVIVLFTGNLNNELLAQESIWAFNWNPATPMGDLENWIGETSLRGWSFEGRRFMTDNVSLGGYLGFNGFFEEKPRGLLDINNTTINAKSWRYLYSLPVLVTTHYYIGEGWIKPYVGIGLGIYYTEEELQVGTFRSKETSFDFGFAPEIGVFVPFGLLSNVGALVAVKYNQVFYTSQNIDGMSYINYSLGIAFKY